MDLIEVVYIFQPLKTRLQVVSVPRRDVPKLAKLALKIGPGHRNNQMRLRPFPSAGSMLKMGAKSNESRLP